MSFTANLAKAYQVHRRKVLVVGTIGGLAVFQYTGLNPISRIFRTPGVENIENRFSSGGGTKTHIPGAATRRGDSENVSSGAQKDQGIGSDKFREKVGEQKPDGSGFDKAWNKMNYGQDKGK
ncbi:MAG: hypothetical protein M1830_003440 [Pleopsidium flavum]|nr:MAG: hypothetical protein M1830_003440 [Pleopsidium flavum]